MMAQKCFKTNSFGIISFTQCVVCSKVVSSIVRSWSIVCNDGLFYASNFQSMIFSVFFFKESRNSRSMQRRSRLIFETALFGRNWAQTQIGCYLFFGEWCSWQLVSSIFFPQSLWAWITGFAHWEQSPVCVKKAWRLTKSSFLFFAWTSLQMGLLGVMQNKPSCQVSLRSFLSQAEAQL